MPALLPALVSGLVACAGDTPQTRLEDYRQRMERVLDAEPVFEVGASTLARFPARRDLQQSAQQSQIGMLDLWAIQGCELQRLVAQKNSSLGKVAASSTALFYELDFLRLAPVCIAQLQGDAETELAAQLELAVAAKQQRLPTTIWQGLLGGDENRSFWRRPASLQAYPVNPVLEADAAIAALLVSARSWLAGDYRVDSAAIELQLQQLGRGDGGALYKSLDLQGRYLDAVNRMIDGRLATRVLCHNTTGIKATALGNVVQKFFIDSIQPWSVLLQARVFAALPSLQQLEQLLAQGEPAAYAQWRQQRDSTLAKLSQAPQQHVQTLLPLMQQCGYNVSP